MAHTCNPSAWEPETGGLLWGQCHLGLYGEFQERLDCSWDLVQCRRTGGIEKNIEKKKGLGKKVGYRYTGSFIEMWNNETTSLWTTWLEMEIIMLNEMGQTQKNKCHIFWFMFEVYNIWSHLSWKQNGRDQRLRKESQGNTWGKKVKEIVGEKLRVDTVSHTAIKPGMLPHGKTALDNSTGQWLQNERKAGHDTTRL